jgi:hypothetical protein
MFDAPTDIEIIARHHQAERRAERRRHRIPRQR